jgi:hypothetical protein
MLEAINEDDGTRMVEQNLSGATRSKAIARRMAIAKRNPSPFDRNAA